MNKLIKQAFTLIELLVVIAIIGILSGLIVVSIGGMTTKAAIAKSQIFSNSLRNSLMMNLISEWKFDSISGTIDSTLSDGTSVADTWGTNNGQTAGGPILRNGNNCVSGQCLQFDGSNDYVNCGNGSSLNFGTNNFTFSLWVKTTVAQSTPGISILSKTGAAPYWIFYITRDGSYIEFVPADSAAREQYFSNAYTKVNDGNWHLLTLVENYGIGGTLYIDGLYHNTYTKPFSSLDNSTNSLRIGETNFAGSLDDVRIFNAAIPTSQIKEQYYAGLNSLLNNGSITQKEYSQRMSGLAKN